ncbi:MAG: M42 family peptidase [Desulfobacteraceae bacterium]|nr:MAG: M42 family peptidase [Desulfobacteraceae bacterium]
MIELIKELIEVHAISGYETPLRHAIETKLPQGIKKQTDAMGNLVVEIGSGPDELLFVAHMDELGLIVADIREDGFIRVRSLGGIDPRVMPGRMLRILTKQGEVKGVVGLKPPHLMAEDRKEMKKVMSFEELYLDVGADSAAEAAALGIEVLDPITFAKTFEILNHKYVSARGLDDRAGCAILLKALEKVQNLKLKKKVLFAFSVQEERGLRGAQLIGSKYQPRFAFAIDTASSGLTPDSNRSLGPAVLGKGPALRAMDNRYLADPAFVKEIKSLAESKNIPVQVIFTGGSTDVAALDVQGPKTLPIAFPVRYTHSTAEMVSLKDLEYTLNLILAVIDRYTA